MSDYTHEESMDYVLDALQRICIMCRTADLEHFHRTKKNEIHDMAAKLLELLQAEPDYPELRG